MAVADIGTQHNTGGIHFPVGFGGRKKHAFISAIPFGPEIPEKICQSFPRWQIPFHVRKFEVAMAVDKARYDDSIVKLGGRPFRMIVSRILHGYNGSVIVDRDYSTLQRRSVACENILG